MLFGDLKNCGWLTITVDEDKLVLVAKPKTPKVPLLSTESSNATENDTSII